MPCLKTAVDIALSKVIFSWERNYGDGSIFLVLPYFINGSSTPFRLDRDRNGEMVMVFCHILGKTYHQNFWL